MLPLLLRGSRQLVHHGALRRDAQHQPGLPGRRVVFRPAHGVDLLLQGQERRLSRHRPVYLAVFGLGAVLNVLFLWVQLFRSP